MPLASLAPAAEIRLQLLHSGASLSEVPRDDESYANTSSEKDEEQQEFIKDIVRGGYERGRERGRGWNHRIVEGGEIALSDDEEVSQRVIRRGRQGGGR
jgi:hypothetical protein